jgi:hypothetical protein
MFLNIVAVSNLNWLRIHRPPNRMEIFKKVRYMTATVKVVNN